MISLVLNFLKRAVFVPIGVLVLAIAACSMLLTRTGTVAPDADNGKGEIDLASYHVVEYDNFSRLEEDAYVGAISCENAELGQTAVLCRSETGANVSLMQGSKEPWKKGGVLLKGKNTFNQLRALHAAQKGDVVVFDFYNNASYRYKITRIVPNVKEGEIKDYYKDKTLVMCVPYNDFSNLGDSYFYTLYIAKQI